MNAQLLMLCLQLALWAAIFYRVHFSRLMKRIEPGPWIFLTVSQSTNLSVIWAVIVPVLMPRTY